MYSLLRKITALHTTQTIVMSGGETQFMKNHDGQKFL